MGGYERFWSGFDWWWIFSIAMIVLCIFMMGRGKCAMMRWPTSGSGESEDSLVSLASAREILDRRYALGEISREEYEEKKRDMSD